jgi:hypothetical protein
MAHAGWFNENGQRSYPFLAGTVDNPLSASDSVQRLPRSLVLDAQFILGINTEYDAREHFLWLDSIERDGAELTLVIKSDAEALEPLTITMAVTASDEIQVVQAVSVFTRYNLACAEDFAWEGFLTFGAFSEASLDAWIGDGDTLSGEDQATQFEPATVRTLFKSYARSLNVANARRTHAQADEGCEPLAWPDDEERPEDWPEELGTPPTTINAECLDGHVRFHEGYNAAIEVNASANEIIISARPGSGAGETQCDPIILFDDEEPPATRSTLDGGLRCAEVFRSINGVGGPNVPISGGAGVTVTGVPDDSKVIVAIDGHALRTCYPAEDPPAEEDCEAIAATSTTAGEDEDGNGGNAECGGRIAWLWTGDEWVQQPDYPGYSTGCSGTCLDCQAVAPVWTPDGSGVLDVTHCRCYDEEACSSADAPLWYWDPDLHAWFKLEGSGTCPAGCVAYPPPDISGDASLPTVVRGVCVRD